MADPHTPPRPAADEMKVPTVDDVVEASTKTPDPMQCCCGSPACVFLKHNCTVLESVEKDVHTAARMGQVGRPISQVMKCHSWAYAVLRISWLSRPYAKDWQCLRGM
jgi:hypothetical protein